MYDNDFTGFKYNGVHFTIFPYSGEENVIKLAHVSDGSRYTDELLPQFQDQAVNVPGGDGTYYFGTNFTSKTFSIDFAFDELSEADLRKLRQTFAKRDELAPLIFDESPYKYWMVKCQGMPSIKTICFNGGETLQRPEFGGPSTGTGSRVGDPFYQPFEYNELGGRIYKGEGNVQFIAYYPFARCGSNGTSKWGISYVSTAPSSGQIYAPTRSQWQGAARLADTSAFGSSSYYDQVASYSEQGLHVTYLKNPGDMVADFSIAIGVPSSYTPTYERLIGIRPITATISSDNTTYQLRSTKLSELVVAVGSKSDDGVIYNTRTRLLEGYKKSNTNPVVYTLSGNVYNRYIDEANSNMIGVPLEDSKLSVPTGFIIEKLDYDYIYY